jgi:hypothetical protein
MCMALERKLLAQRDRLPIGRVRNSKRSVRGSQKELLTAITNRRFTDEPRRHFGSRCESGEAAGRATLSCIAFNDTACR